MCDPATMAAVAGTAQKAIGEKQPGSPAPPPMFGMNPGVGGSNALSPLSMGGGGSFGGGFGGQAKQSAEVGGLLQETNAEIAPSNEVGPPAANPYGQEPGTVGPPSPEEDPLNKKPQGGFMSAFEESMNKSLNSPARLLGVGLLNQMQYPLGTAGLLGKGVFDAFRR